MGKRKQILYSILFEFNSVHLDLIINELVDIGDNCGALDVHQDEAWNDLGVKSAVCSSGRAGVHVKLVLMLICLKLVCVTGY